MPTFDWIHCIIGVKRLSPRAVSGGSAFLGAPFDDDAGFLRGSAYFFECQGDRWVQVGKALPPPPDALGYNAAINGNTAISGPYVYEVAPTLPCIPAIGEWGVVILALLISAIGCLRLRRLAARVAASVLLLVGGSANAFQPNFNAGRVDERVLVRFQPGSTPAQKQNAHTAAETIEVLKQYSIVADLELVQVPPGSVEEVIARYLTDPRVLFAEPDYQLQALAVPNDPLYSQQWNMVKIRAPEAWNMWTGELAPGFLIAVIDNGVSRLHGDLAANIWTNPEECPGGFGTCVENGIDDDANGYVDDFWGWDFESGDNEPSPGGHGTSVAGVVGAVGNNSLGIAGTAWRCKIVVLKTTFSIPNLSASISSWIDALEYVVAKGIRVSNNSYGCTSCASNAFYQAIQATQSIGHIFVAAAGNSSGNSDFFPIYPAAYDLPNIISVANSGNTDNLATHSNYGCNSVDLAAPGDELWSTFPSGYGPETGISFATPHVAAAVAMVMAKNPTWTWLQVRDHVLKTSKKS